MHCPDIRPLRIAPLIDHATITTPSTPSMCSVARHKPSIRAESTVQVVTETS